MEQLLIQTESKSYPVFIGDVLTKLLDVVDSLKKKPTSIFIITDKNVGDLYVEEVKSVLFSFKVVSYTVPSGESSKSFEAYYECHSIALENNLDRDSLIIALGGGVIGDLAGFVAATYMRGIRFIQVPTTLLAHDSAVGGKVAINHPKGKNMIGAFYQPEAVIYHLPFLKTLPLEELRSGFGEVIKHGYLSENQFLDWIDKNIQSFKELDQGKLLYIISEGIKVKANIVSQDEKEKGIRAHLNFGHTLAHAIESEMGYGGISHGDAVAIGMRFALMISEKIFNIRLDTMKLDALLDRFQFPKIPVLDIDSLINKMKQDKKSYGGNVHMVLMKDIGLMEVVKVPENLIRESLLLFINESI